MVNVSKELLLVASLLKPFCSWVSSHDLPLGTSSCFSLSLISEILELLENKVNAKGNMTINDVFGLDLRGLFGIFQYCFLIAIAKSQVWMMCWI